MTNHELQLKAQKEWNGSPTVRRRYPTFEFYWHEQYERVYAVARKTKGLDNLVNRDRPVH